MSLKTYLKTPSAIVGIGLSGSSAKRLLLRSGVSESELTSFDQSLEHADYQDPKLMLQEVQVESLVVSPGVPLSTKWIQNFKQNGGQITSELSIALSLLRDEKIVGVTGSLGKSTVVSLLKAGAETAGEKVFLGGNIGTPLADYVCDLLDGKREKADCIILELSSFQLENLDNFKADCSAISYLAGNHLERYSSKAQYYDQKWTLCERTKGHIFLNANSSELREYTQSKQQANIDWVSKNDCLFSPTELDSAQLLGNHNRDNLALAAAIANQLGWSNEYKKGMLAFPGLAHRFENLGHYKNIHFINDSKATNLTSVVTAVETITDSENTLHLLLGGQDKNLNWRELEILKKRPNLQIHYFGECGKDVFNLLKIDGSVSKCLAELMPKLPKLVKSGDCVLLSPGGTSLDEFKNFAARGEFFVQSIQKYFS